MNEQLKRLWTTRKKEQKTDNTRPLTSHSTLNAPWMPWTMERKLWSTWAINNLLNNGVVSWYFQEKTFRRWIWVDYILIVVFIIAVILIILGQKRDCVSSNHFFHHLFALVGKSHLWLERKNLSVSFRSSRFRPPPPKHNKTNQIKETILFCDYSYACTSSSTPFRSSEGINELAFCRRFRCLKKLTIGVANKMR